MEKPSRKQMLSWAMAVYEEKEKGSDDCTIMDLLGVDAEEYQEVLDFMFESKTDEIRKRKPEHIYIQYCMDQKSYIRELDELVKNLNEKTQYNAIVGAIRLKSEIRDKIITRGQEFGVIAKAPDRKHITGAFMLTDLSDKELKLEIAKGIVAVKSTIKKYGEKNILELPEPRELYYGDAAIDTTGEEPHPKRIDGSGSKKSKRSAGRRRVRE